MAKNQEKLFKTLDEMERYLIDTKNIVPSRKIKDYLVERPYVSAINPYKKIVAKGKDDKGHVYDGSVEIDVYISLASLDDAFSVDVYRRVMIFERLLKRVLGTVVSQFLVNNGDVKGTSYVDAINTFLSDMSKSDSLRTMGLVSIDTQLQSNGYITCNEGYVAFRMKLLKDTILSFGTGTKKSENNIVRHYQNNHPLVPFWLLVHEFTLKDMGLLYNMLNKDLQTQVHNAFFPDIDKVSYKKIVNFSGLIEQVRKLRNVTCHYESILGYLSNLPSQRNKHAMHALEVLNQFAQKSIVYYESIFDASEAKNNGYNDKMLDLIKDVSMRLK